MYNRLCVRAAAGHMEVKLTLDKIQIFFVWLGMIKRVICHLRSCTDCQMKKRPIKQR
jgi:hypothetical protein